MNALTRVSLLVALLLALGGQACSTPVPSDERFRGLDSETKRIFLALYPELTPDQRRAVIEGDSFYDALPDLEHNHFFTRRDEQSRLEFIGQPKSYTVTEVLILTNRPLPLTDSKPLELRAEVRFADGRKADATNDVTWDVEPKKVHFRDHRLTADCFHSDVVVSANFLGEKTSSLTVPIRMPVRALEVGLKNSSQGAEEGAAFQVEATLVCQDGSKQDVSCQAAWSGNGNSSGIEVSGCGWIRMRSGKVPNYLRVRATYGGVTTQSQIAIPPRFHGNPYPP